MGICGVVFFLRIRVGFSSLFCFFVFFDFLVFLLFRQDVYIGVLKINYLVLEEGGIFDDEEFYVIVKYYYNQGVKQIYLFCIY